MNGIAIVNIECKTPNHTVVLLTKEAIVGKVKTRLATAIGMKNAMYIHYEMCIYIIEYLVNNQIPLVVSLDQQIKEGKIYQYCRSKQILTSLQKEGDLGEKIGYEMNRYPRCVVLGADTPIFLISEIQNALHSTELVLGPTEDGGYWLIAMNKPHINLFEHISWSTSQVLSQTLQNAKKLQYPVHLLSKRYDIDTHSDLQKLLSDSNIPLTLKQRILPYA